MSLLTLKRIKSNISGYILLSVGYIISILVISICFSFSKNVVKLSLDDTHGISSHQSNIIVRSDKNLINYNDIENAASKYSNSAKLEVNGIEDRLPMPKDDIGMEVYVVPVIYKNKPEWLPNILSGRFLTGSESCSEEKKAVIGVIVASVYFPDGINDNSYITLGNDKYKIIGIAGRGNTGVLDYERNIYIPLNTLPDKYKENLKEININILTEKNLIKQIQNSMINDISKSLKDVQVSYAVSNPYLNNVYMSLGTMIIISVIILVVAVINIISFSTFVIMRRRREFAISKLLGATEKILGLNVLYEMLIIGIISSFIAMLIQICITPVIVNMLKGKMFLTFFNVTYINLIIGILVAIIIAIATTIVPFKKIVRLNAAEEIKVE